MRGYEAIFIFRPSLNEEERMNHVEKIEKIISAKGVLHETNYWGRKRFAYPIQRFTDGHFYLFVFDSEATVPYELKRLTKITETILRSLIIVRDTTYRPKEVPPQAPAAQNTERLIEPVSTENISPEPMVEIEPVEEEAEKVEEIKIEDTNAE